MRGDIEGLRTVAVLFVLVYHLGVNRLSGGFAGVDIFFVISGFLITSGLIKDTERRGRVSLSEFYARRARRLLPAASVVLVFTALVGSQVMPEADLGNLASDVAAAALYVVNWALAFRSVDYLAEDASVSPVQHYWSLSVEEQFYVVIPILMIVLALLARRLHLHFRRILTISIAAIVVASFVYSVVHTASSPETAYFFSTTRAWELGIGSLVACAVPLLRKLPRPGATVLAAVGLLAALASGVLISSATPWPGYAAALPTLGTAAVIAAGVAHADTVTGRLLGLRPMVWIGGLSYSIYLWHWPLIVFANELGYTRWRHRILIAVASIALAWLSKKFIEDPIRFRGPWAKRARPALAMGAVGMTVSVLAATSVWLQAPRLEGRPPAAQGAAALVAEGASRSVPSRVSDPTPQLTTQGTIYPDPALAPKDVPAYYADKCQVQPGDVEIDERCVYGDPDGSVTVALTGDSKAGQWFDVINAIAKERGWRLELYLKSACGLNPAQIEDDCLAFNENVMERLTSEEGRADVVITSAVRGGSKKGNPERYRAYVDGYDEYWKQLEAVGTSVIALSDTPQPGNGDYPRYECASDHPDDLLECAFPANDGVGTAALRAATELGDKREFFDLNPWVCPETQDGKCPIVVGEVLVYRQGSHVTKTYADTMRPVFEELFDKAGLAAS